MEFTKRGKSGGIVFRVIDPLKIVERPDTNTDKPTPTKSPQQWLRESQSQQQGLGDSLKVLAERLGVCESSLVRLQTGYDYPKNYYTFPERNATGDIIGQAVRRVRPNGTDGKWQVKGGNRGIYIPDSWDVGGPVYLVEGASDVAAMMTLGGLSVIGRPQNNGGVYHLAEFFKDFDPKRELIVVGENDKDGDSWPGKEGATTTAKQLTDLLGRPVYWAMPPIGTKDIRELLKSRGLASKALFSEAINHTKTLAKEPQTADFAPDLLPVIEPEGEAKTLPEYRAEMAAKLNEMIQTPGIHILNAPTGGGKSYLTNEAVKRVGSSLTILPTHANVRERLDELKQAGVDAVAYPELNETTCGRYEEAKKLVNLGLQAGATICQGCPLRKDCEYQSQMAKASKAKHRVGTHERGRLSTAMGYTGSNKTRKPVELVVIDEMPTTVLAPDITTEYKHIHPVESFCEAAHHFHLKSTPEEKAFADAMKDVKKAIENKCENIEQAGTVRIELPASMGVPDNWQRLVANIISKAGVRANPEALRLITRAAAGDLKELYITTDIRLKKDGGERVLNHCVYGRFQPGLPKDVPTICTDATTKPEDIEAATGMTVQDQTPTGHLEVIQPVRHILTDITKTNSKARVAALVVEYLANNPNVKRLGIIGHSNHWKCGEVYELLPESVRQRIARYAYFGEGPDRGSNQWHVECDALLVMGTPRPNGSDIRRELIRLGLHEAAAHSDGDFGTLNWQGHRNGEVIEHSGRGYRDPDWRRAYGAIGTASLYQAIGRGRIYSKEGIPVTLYTNEQTPFETEYPEGLPKPMVESLRVIENLIADIENDEDVTDIHPINTNYRENVGSDLPAGLILDKLKAECEGTKRTHERWLKDLVAFGLLIKPKRGVYRLPPEPVKQVPSSPEPVTVTNIPATLQPVTVAASSDFQLEIPAPQEIAETERKTSEAIFGEPRVIPETPLTPCRLCGCTDTKAVVINHGNNDGKRSIRLDCAKCDVFVAFEHWYELPPTDEKGTSVANFSVSATRTPTETDRLSLPQASHYTASGFSGFPLVGDPNKEPDVPVNTGPKVVGIEVDGFETHTPDRRQGINTETGGGLLTEDGRPVSTEHNHARMGAMNHGFQTS